MSVTLTFYNTLTRTKAHFSPIDAARLASLRRAFGEVVDACHAITIDKPLLPTAQYLAIVAGISSDKIDRLLQAAEANRSIRSHGDIARAAHVAHIHKQRGLGEPFFDRDEEVGAAAERARACRAERSHGVVRRFRIGEP